MLMLHMTLYFIEAYAGFVKVGKRNISRLVKNKEKKHASYIFSLKVLGEL